MVIATSKEICHFFYFFLLESFFVYCVRKKIYSFRNYLHDDGLWEFEVSCKMTPINTILLPNTPPPIDNVKEEEMDHDFATCAHLEGKHNIDNCEQDKYDHERNNSRWIFRDETALFGFFFVPPTCDFLSKVVE